MPRLGGQAETEPGCPLTQITRRAAGCQHKFKLSTSGPRALGPGKCPLPAVTGLTPTPSLATETTVYLNSLPHRLSSPRHTSRDLTQFPAHLPDL